MTNKEISEDTNFKIKNIISTKPFIKKIISFDQTDNQSDTKCIKDIFSKNDYEEIDFLNLEIIFYLFY